ncbi:hypothetical protein LX36DRAFT_341957 [Colletotrichum falcatum]|nr:hypothetical protein LX36DRAFT_341957 [Colletotrichum falcatum]
MSCFSHPDTPGTVTIHVPFLSRSCLSDFPGKRSDLEFTRLLPSEIRRRHGAALGLILPVDSRILVRWCRAARAALGVAAVRFRVYEVPPGSRPRLREEEKTSEIASRPNADMPPRVVDLVPGPPPTPRESCGGRGEARVCALLGRGRLSPSHIL